MTTSDNTTRESFGAMNYDLFVGRLIKDMGSERDNLMHAAIGVAGEGGELLDAIKKHWAYGKPLDISNVIEELGDLEFYLQAMRQFLSLTREDVIYANVVKLSKRYPGALYSDTAAIARADKQEGQ